MTRRERVITALNHQATDIVPYQVEFTGEQLEKIVSALGMDRSGFFHYLGNHCEKINFNTGGRYIDDAVFEDEFGVRWDRSGIDKDIGNLVGRIIEDPHDYSFTFPELDREKIRELISASISGTADAYIFGKIGMAFFERAWSLCGFQDFMMYLALEQDFVQELLGRIRDYNIAIITEAMKHGIDGFYFGDDYGQQSGLLMNPETWRSLIKPGLADMFKAVKDAGGTVALHSCGDIGAILPDLIEIGLDIYQTVQPEIYDLKELKKKYGSNLAFWGGISTQRDLPFSSPDSLKQTVRDTMSLMSEHGGYIAGPTHRIPPDVPVENSIALIEMLVHQE